MVIIAINLMMSFTFEIYNDPTAFSSSFATTESELMEQYEQEFESEEGIWGSIKTLASRGYESTIGSAIKWGYTTLKIFIRAVNPFAFDYTNFTNPVEQILAVYLTLFRSLLITLVIIEGYMFYINKKNN